MPKSNDTRRWLNQHRLDPYVRLANAEGFRSRAAFKLLEINDRERLLRPGRIVVDLGAAPGGWSQVAARLVAPQGQVVAVDRLPMQPLPGVTVVNGDICAPAVVARVVTALKQQRADVLLSDLAPNLSGIPSMDQAHVVQITELVLGCATALLRSNGNLLIKLFHGTELNGQLACLNAVFRSVRIRKPKASRDRSGEVYALAEGFEAGRPSCTGTVRKSAVRPALGFCVRMEGLKPRTRYP